MTINVDPAEIARFSELAHHWWDPASDFKPLHDINPLRLDYIDRCAGLNGKTVLDVGCGGGILAESMAQRGAQVTGIDLSDKALKVAQLHVLESGVALDYRHTSAEDFARERPQHYDIVTCMELLEHVPDPASTVRACATLAKAGGHVFFSTINRNLKSYLFAVVGAEYVLRMLPRGTHRYEKFVKPSELGGFCRQGSLDVREVIGMTYNPLTDRYALGTDTSVNYLMHCTS
ncbi:MAG TPA: bifunctional 2-polyprenyl-6-hydroxyphenol methylase/3-demethylubiquinol 3-O-methyltransferase UbiG [Burkholderiales bacterium]|jgi:2-polyprenyl-6-hydroxyphenyl methylase/3-demethylubiquinone-9 3-methyltransferase|nr:bifunctional 2-polyprenyl-6-hydroxyphenol methylase/3-demethylubiquinol 3-O-methyltransferase UbiG [Burkholderiales bacterium]